MRRKGFIVLIFLLIAAAVVACFAYRYYENVFKSGVETGAVESVIVYIPSGSDYNQLKDSIRPYLLDEGIFDRLCEVKKFGDNVKPGRYELMDGMSANALVNMLRLGDQKPINFTFNNIRKLEELIPLLATQFELDEDEFRNYIINEKTAETYGFNMYSFPVMFLPDSYEFKWTTSPKEFVSRLNTYYNKFWTSERLNKAESIGLSPEQVSSLASVVEAETKKNDEKPTVAGVYINRLNKGMPLQADPTLVFAHDDFTIRRVLNKHKEINSPFNTYKYAGLPPGPICLPEKSSIDAVLNYEKHDYLFFCAKPDYSGYHCFAKTHNQHINNAKRYQRFLNREGIYR